MAEFFKSFFLFLLEFPVLALIHVLGVGLLVWFSVSLLKRAHRYPDGNFPR